MAAVQYVCAKIGLVTGQGLAGVIRKHRSRRVLVPVVLVLVAANAVNAGVDLGAVADGLHLFVPVPTPILSVAVALVLLALQIFGSYKLIARTFKWLTLSLLAYVATAFVVHPDWHAVLRGTVWPDLHFDRDFLATLVAILGTTISPYLFFWQASQEVEEKRLLGRRGLWKRGCSDTELEYRAWDVNAGMFVSNLVMYFIILASAATLRGSEHPEVNTAADLARALEPVAGRWADAILTVGLVGSGFLAVPVLTTSAAYAVCEAFAWKHGLDTKFREAPRFYGVIIASTLLGTAINFAGVSPVSALFWTSVLNGLLAPPLLVLVMRLSDDPAVMGVRRADRGLVRWLGWLTTGLMAAAAVGLIVTSVGG
jgi:Mn2+/Fe2+ NRAMP family transporter